MGKLAIKFAAILCILAGLATLWLPIPTGLVLLALGLALLLMVSRQVARRLARLRRRYPGLDRWLQRAEPYLPGRLRAALAQTKVRTKAWPVLRKIAARRESHRARSPFQPLE